MKVLYTGCLGILLLAATVGQSGIVSAQSQRYSKVNEDDHALFRSYYEGEGDLYFVELLTKTCTRRSLDRRRRQLEFLPAQSAIKMDHDIGPLQCGIDPVATLSQNVTVRDKLVGWIMVAQDDFCLFPIIDRMAATFSKQCRMTGCRLTIPEGTSIMFVTPVRDVAEAFYESIEVPKMIEGIRNQNDFLDFDTSSEITRKCPSERY